MAKLDFSFCGTIDAALALVESDYKLRNPLTVRCLQFYRCKQEKHESYTNYIVHLKAAAKEADVPIMTTDDIMALQMLGGCLDLELLKKLLEVDPWNNVLLHTRRASTLLEKSKVGAPARGPIRWILPALSGMQTLRATGATSRAMFLGGVQ